MCICFFLIKLALLATVAGLTPACPTRSRRPNQKMYNGVEDEDEPKDEIDPHPVTRIAQLATRTLTPET
jgi:hypothetical protein